MRCSTTSGRRATYLPQFGPYLSSVSNTWGESLNLAGPDADEVRRYIIDCALRWMRDFHADGLRLDAVHALVDNTAIHIPRRWPPKPTPCQRSWDGCCR